MIKIFQTSLLITTFLFISSKSVCFSEQACISEKTFTGIDKNAKLHDELLASAPEEILDFVKIFEFAQKIKKYLPTRLLLVGAPGVGKTDLAIAIAQKIGDQYTIINAPTIANEFQNSGAQNVRRIFENIIDSQDFHVLIIDEVNSLTDQFNAQKLDEKNIAMELWLMLDKADACENILVIATTNDATKMPDQLKNRFEGHVIEIVACNDAGARLRVLKYYLAQFTHECSNEYLKMLSEKTQNFVPRQIKELVLQALRNAVLRNNHLPIISQKDFEKSFNNFMKNRQLSKSLLGFDYDKLGSRLATWSSVCMAGISFTALIYKICMTSLKQS